MVKLSDDCILHTVYLFICAMCYCRFCCGYCALLGLSGVLCPCQLGGKPVQSVLSCLPLSAN